MPEISRDERVLVLAPIGRDAPLMCQVLNEAFVRAEVCPDLGAFCRDIASGIGAAIIADEALSQDGLSRCIAALAEQPTWSDLPLIVLTTRDHSSRDAVVAERLRPLGHVTILERPVRVATLVSAARAALRSRQRQYEVRDHLAELRRAEQEIRLANEQLSAARDEALEANRVKSRFLANMSHELRTPLNAIIGYAEMIREECQERGHRDLAEDTARVLDAGRHLLSLINDILDLSKIEAGRMTLLAEPVDVKNLLQGVTEITAPLLRRNSNLLQLNCPEGIGSFVTDEGKLRQCLLNLLSNACKFTEHGRICLTVSIDLEQPMPWIHFRVTDTGIGISPDDQKRLFSEFVQLDSSSTRRHGGTGLGLALTRRFCELMGGGLDVVSHPGDGSTFTIRLPMRSWTPGSSPPAGGDGLSATPHQASSAR